MASTFSVPGWRFSRLCCRATITPQALLSLWNPTRCPPQFIIHFRGWWAVWEVVYFSKSKSKSLFHLELDLLNMKLFLCTENTHCKGGPKSLFHWQLFFLFSDEGQIKESKSFLHLLALITRCSALLWAEISWNGNGRGMMVIEHPFEQSLYLEHRNRWDCFCKIAFIFVGQTRWHLFNLNTEWPSFYVYLLQIQRFWLKY